MKDGIRPMTRKAKTAEEIKHIAEEENVRFYD